MTRAGWLLLACLGCSSSDPVSAGADTGAADTRAADTAPEVTAACAVCDKEFSGTPPAKQFECVRALDASLIDTDGKPLSGVTIMACSASLCTTGVSDAAGLIHVEPCHYLPNPVFKVFGFETYVPFSVPLRNPADTFRFDKVPVVRIPAKGVPIEVGKAQTLSMAGLSLDIPAAADNVQLDPFAPYSDFRAVKIPIDKLAPGLDQGLGLEIVYGVGPQNTLLGAPAKLTVANDKGWPAGTAVEIHLHNWERLTGAPVPPGLWWKAATAKVSADGKTIVSDPGAGVTAFGLVGLRKAP